MENDINLDKKIENISSISIVEIELNNEQKLLILKRWEQLPVPSISELVKLVWNNLPDSQCDGRSLYGRKIKEYLLEKGLNPITKIEHSNKKSIELTKEQQEYITNNCCNMTPLELTKELFNSHTISPASIECRAVTAFWKNLPNEIKYKTNLTATEYRPPKTLDQVLARVNRFVKDNGIDRDKMKPLHKKCLEVLISYLHDYRLISQINTYENIDDKILFESSFISYCWDKSDLSSEDVHLYIILCTEVVMSASIQRTINMLQKEQDRQMDENDGKLSMALVEAINVARTEYNGSVKRQETLFKSLITERSKRLKERIGPEFTLLNIIEEMKNEERRKILILEAEKRNERLKGEIKRLSEMDEIIARLYGTDEDLIING